VKSNRRGRIDGNRYGCYKFLLYPGTEVTTAEQDLGAEVCVRLARTEVVVRTKSV
jgi:hypothetical protein